MNWKIVISVVAAFLIGAVGAFGYQAAVQDTPDAQPMQPGGEATTQPASTETPAVPENPPTGMSTDDGEVTVNESAILDAHFKTLDTATTYTVAFSEQHGPVGQRFESVVGDSRTYALTESDGKREQVFSSTAMEETYKRTDVTTSDGNRVTSYTTANIVSESTLMKRNTVAAVISVADLDYAEDVVVDGEEATRLTVTGFENNSKMQTVLNVVGEPQSASGSVVVTDEGRIARMNVSVTSVSDTNVTVESRFEMQTDTRVLSPTQPDWVGVAKTEAVQMNVTQTGSVAEMEKTGGEEIPKGVTVRAFLNGEVYTSQLPATVTDGDTVYVTISNNELVVSVNDPVTPGDTAPSFVRIVNGADTQVYFDTTIGVEQ